MSQCIRRALGEASQFTDLLLNDLAQIEGPIDARHGAISDNVVRVVRVVDNVVLAGAQVRHGNCVKTKGTVVTCALEGLNSQTTCTARVASETGNQSHDAIRRKPVQRQMFSRENEIVFAVHARRGPVSIHICRVLHCAYRSRWPRHA